MDRELRILERKAALGDLDAQKRLEAMQRRMEIHFPPEGLWLNCYISGQAMGTLVLFSNEEYQEAYDFLHEYFSTGPFEPWERAVYDIHLKDTVMERRGPLLMVLGDSPCFDFAEGRPINYGNYDPYVSFNLIEGFPDPDEEPAELVLRHRDTGTFYVAPTAEWAEDIEEATRYTQSEADAQGDMFYTAEYVEYAVWIPKTHWINVYETTRNYGGPEEGGWYYNHDDPYACVNLGVIKPYRPRYGTTVGSYPDHVSRINEFFLDFYAHLQHGDIYSVNGGSQLSLVIQDHIAERTPRPHYE